MTDRSRADRVWGAITAHADKLGVPISLRVLCETAAARLPVTGVAVVVPGGFVASEPICLTGPLSRRLEELQLTIGEGPTLEVLAGAGAILVEDLDALVYQVRWPLFAPQAVRIGARAMFVLPLRIGAVRGGVLVLCADCPGRLSAEDLAEAWVFAELTLELLFDEQDGIGLQDGRPVTSGYFETRPEVHQATGMVSVQLGISVGEAFARLRARAFAENRPLSELATDVVARRIRFAHEDTG
ncbi:MAG TPA: GAF and ANTAR domain-containing protein [Pseudonocardiaceae bacterium]|nr:GAF and ANTAR domain-containing protein [Pseudonocardiaceae bacterium]